MANYRSRRVDPIAQTEWEAESVKSLLQSALEGRLGGTGAKRFTDDWNSDYTTWNSWWWRS